MVGGLESKRTKRKRGDETLQENLPKDWFWVWWPDSGWWKVRITEVEEEEWYWPGTQEPLDTPILPLTISYDSHKTGNTCFIEQVLWHDGVLYDQEGEEKISYCLSPPQENVANNSENQPKDIIGTSPSSPSANSSETGSTSLDKMVTEKNKDKVHPNTKVTKASTSPRKNSFMQEKVAENLREKAKNVLSQTLLENIEEANVETDKTHIEKIAVDIEQALFQKYFKADYLAQLRSITFNLRGKRNLELKRAIVVAEISPTRLAEMTADELASKSMREERRRREQESFARAVIRDPTEVGIVKGLNTTEVVPQRSEEKYEMEQVFQKETALLQGENAEVQLEGAESEAQTCSSPVSGELIHEEESNQNEPTMIKDKFEQNNNMEVQQSSNTTVGNFQLPMFNGLDDKFQQFATSVGEPERPSRSILRGSTTEAIRSKKRTAVWQGDISFEETISFQAMAFYLVGPNNYAILPEQMNIIGRTELGSTIEFVKGLEHSTSREFSVVYFKPRSAGDESGFKELVDFLSRRRRAGVLFQTGQSEAYILPPGKLASHIHDYGRERVLGVIVTRKTALQERPVLSLNKQVNIAESDHVSFQSSQDGALNEESKDSVSLDTRPIQLSPEVSKQVAVSEPEKQSSSPAVATTDIPTNTSPKKGLVNSNITEERHKILPGLPKEPQLASVLGFRSLPGIPGLNKAQESDKGSLPK
ncbi:hypothetical protein GAYE_FCTG49G0096 [Galdieria yellowstonensis]|uniref:TFIIS central domain-containing protein n=1 Tax=Galdieria yellowstonensis TaxID=3028027 RepID=A0AAV9I4I6_9RHOD|nr:hypothetical protein GAYE_FCTG49G0096 [Galdieria yellowstonensis]